MQVTLELQGKKLEALKSLPAPGAKAKAKEKKVERLEAAMKRDAVRELGAVRFKQGLVVSLIPDQPCAHDTVAPAS